MSNRKIKIGIIGSGVVGQATGKGFSSKNFDVLFVDVNPSTVESLKNQGCEAYLVSELPEELTWDVSIFTVPTPTVDGALNFKYLKEASKELGKKLALTKKYHLFVVRSTVLPGTTEGTVLKLLEKYSGKKAGKHFGLCMNPEYLREASSVDDFANPWIVVIGEFDKRSGDLMERVYKRFKCPIYRIPIKDAEMQKYVHNLYNAVKITFFNEMRQIGKEIKVDSETIFKLTAKSCEGMWNPRYGTRDFGPFSGACLPKDTKAFHSWALKKGFDVALLETAIAVNESIRRLKTYAKESFKSGFSSLPL